MAAFKFGTLLLTQGWSTRWEDLRSFWFVCNQQCLHHLPPYHHIKCPRFGEPQLERASNGLDSLASAKCRFFTSSIAGTLESLKKCVMQFNKLSYLCCYCSKYVYFLEIYFLSGRCSAISQWKASAKLERQQRWGWSPLWSSFSASAGWVW